MKHYRKKTDKMMDEWLARRRARAHQPWLVGRKAAKSAAMGKIGTNTAIKEGLKNRHIV